MTAGGFDGLTQTILYLVEQELMGLDGSMKDALKRCGSPIEELFCKALVAHDTWVARGEYGLLFADSTSMAERLRDVDHVKREGNVIVEQQAVLPELDGWRVDFLFHVWSTEILTPSPGRHIVAGEWRRLIVECDGHDYHERTKQQAKRDRSRDRAASDAGFGIYRFTGSEIWGNPLVCVEQVFDWIVGASNK